MSLLVEPLLVLGKHFVCSTLPRFDTLVNIYALLQLLVITRNVDAHILKQVLQFLYLFPNPVLCKWQ